MSTRDGGFVPAHGGCRANCSRTLALSHRIQSGILHGWMRQGPAAARQRETNHLFRRCRVSRSTLQKVVVTSLRAVEVAGQASRFSYEIHLTGKVTPPHRQDQPFGGRATLDWRPGL
jgi:hypothetical protein